MIATRTALALAAALLTANAATAATTTTLNFDERSESALFYGTNALTDRYAPLGITFSGTSTSAGGSILDQAGNFGFDALSGRNFLAFNTQLTGNVETIAFASSYASVSIWGASSMGGAFTMNAYSVDGTLLDSAVADFSTNWTQLSVASNGIARIELIGNNAAYAYDDLSVSAVPEPSTWGMLFAGLGVMGWMMRRRTNA